MKRVCLKNKAQMKLSFGMIFSIILIVFFMAFAFFAIKKFLEEGDAIVIGKFVDKLQDDVDKIWKGSQGSQGNEYDLTRKVKSICFVDFNSEGRGFDEEIFNEINQVFYGDENFVFYPLGSAGDLNSFNIKHINITEITETRNPFCIKTEKQKVNLIIQKDYGENLVRIGE